MRLTRGAQRLAQCGLSQVEIAARLSARLGRTVNQGRVSAYVRGRHLPQTQVAVAMRLEFGIELEDWIAPADEPSVEKASGPSLADPDASSDTLPAIAAAADTSAA